MADIAQGQTLDRECARQTHALERRLHFLWVPGRRVYLAKESFALGQICRSRGLLPLAETNFRRVVELFKNRHPGKDRKSLPTFAVVAAAHNHLGLVHLDAARPAEGAPCFDQAIELRRELQRLFPGDRENVVFLGGALCNRGHSVADLDAAAARRFYEESLAVLRQPVKPCECSYWDEQRQSWWCEQLEAMGDALGLAWVALAPQFIDHALRGLASLEGPTPPHS